MMEGVQLTLCKHWVRNPYVKERLTGIVKAGKTTMKDVQFLAHLCTEGTVDPVKRDFRAVVKSDGILVVYNSPAGEGVQSAVYCSETNPHVVQAFHFATPVSLKKNGWIRQGVRQFLDCAAGPWDRMRSTPVDRVQGFLMQKGAGENSFFHVQRPVRPMEDVHSSRVEVRFRPKDAEDIALVLKEKGQGTWVGQNGEMIRFEECVVQDMPAFVLRMSRDGSQPFEKEMIASYGLCGVILERNHVSERERVYVHGLRSLVKSIASSLEVREPRAVRISSSYLDLGMAREVMRGMGLVTNRPIGKDARFGALAEDLNIRHVTGDSMKRRMFSAFGFQNHSEIMRAAGMGVSQGDVLVAKGFVDEQVQDMVLAARAVVGDARPGVRLLNCVGCTQVLPVDMPVGEYWDADLQLSMGGKDVMVYTVDQREVEMKLGSAVAVVGEARMDRAVVMARNGVVFAVYCDPCVRPARVIEGDLRPDFVTYAGSHMQEAVGRLCYIVAACRAHPELRESERSLRAVWFITESGRRELRGNVHDIAVLSMMAKDCSGSAHYSLLPYV